MQKNQKKIFKHSLFIFSLFFLLNSSMSLLLAAESYSEDEEDVSSVEAKNTNDTDLVALINLVKKYYDKLAPIVDEIRSNRVSKGIEKGKVVEVSDEKLDVAIPEEESFIEAAEEGSVVVRKPYEVEEVAFEEVESEKQPMVEEEAMEDSEIPLLDPVVTHAQESSLPIIDPAVATADEGLLDDDEETMVAAGGGLAAAIGGAAVIADKGGKVISAVRDMKDIADYGTTKKMNTMALQETSAKSVDFQKKLVDDRKIQAERKVAAYKEQGNTAKATKWQDRLRELRAQTDKIEDQRKEADRLQERLKDDSIKGSAKNALTRDAYDRQKVLGNQVLTNESAALEKRMDKYKGIEKEGGLLTPKQMLKKNMTEQRLEKIQKQRAALDDAPMSKQKKATTTSQKLRNIHKNEAAFVSSGKTAISEAKKAKNTAKGLSSLYSKKQKRR